MKSDRSGDVQYAALPWRRRGEGAEVLLVTSRRTKRWIVPKGWPIEGLEPARTAAQEALEEAGVEGRTGPLIGAYHYDKQLKNGGVRRLRVELYPLEVDIEFAEWPEATERTRRWLSPSEAAELVHEPELSALLTGFSAPSAPQRT